nr:hypothetical protein [Tanacetum cinerariifolium]
QFNPINKPKGNTNNNNNSTNNNTPPENPNSPPIFNSNKRKKDDSEGDKLDQNELNRRARNNAANQKSRAKKKAAGIKRKPVPKVGELDAKGREERDKVNARTKKWRAARKENMSDQELFEHNTQVAWTSYKYRNFKGLSPDKLELEREKYFYTKSEERRQKILYDALPEYKKIELEQEKINLKKQKEHEYHRKRWADQKVHMANRAGKAGGYIAPHTSSPSHNDNTQHNNPSSSLDPPASPRLHPEFSHSDVSEVPFLVKVPNPEMLPADLLLGSPPPATSKNEVLKFLSVNTIVIPPANTGNDNNSKTDVTITAQPNKANLCNLIPGLLIFKIVVMKFIEPNKLLIPDKCKAKMAKSTLGPLLGKAMSGPPTNNAIYCTPGPDNSILIRTENAVPNRPENNAKIKYKIPISLAFEERNQRSIPIVIWDILPSGLV